MQMPFFTSGFNSGARRDWDSIHALVLAFVSRFEQCEQPLYITKLLKLLFYFDFLSYKHNERSFTGDVYVKLPYGPVPSIIKDQLDLLKYNNEENEEIDEYELQSSFLEHLDVKQDPETKGYALQVKNKNEERLNELGEYHLSVWDRELIDNLVKFFKEASVKEIVEQTHQEKPYKKTSEVEIISYLLAGEDGFPKAKIEIPEPY